jgi:4-amino-4-deoxy-L-arabinose transferase-like glycosyltransferase
MAAGKRAGFRKWAWRSTDGAWQRIARASNNRRARRTAGPPGRMLYSGVLSLLRRHRWWFAGVGLTALLLRLFFVWKMAAVTDDSVFYGDIARCLIHFHGYGTEIGSGWAPTLSRLPGYPLFLAFSFLIGGEGSYRTAMLLQVGFDLLTCLLVADVARRMLGERAAQWAFLLAALCPFLINYAAAALTECLEIFCIAAALDCAVAALHVSQAGGLHSHLSRNSGGEGGAPAPGEGGAAHSEDAAAYSEGGARRALRWWALCGVACAGAILLRPDGGLILAGIGLPVTALAWRDGDTPASPKASRTWGARRELAAAMLLLGAVSLAPLVPWTIRNWRVYHVFQPLVNTHASDPGEFVPLGWGRWFRSWAIDYANVEDVDFQVPGSAVDLHDIPSRAYDSAAQRDEVRRLLAQYNGGGYRMTPELDRQFAALAGENIRLHPLRYYLLLPAARTLDIWLRPRTELLPLDPHFWRIASEPFDALCSLALAALNLAYVAAAVAGAWVMRRRMRGVELGLLLSYPLLRSLSLAALGGAEDRYTLECFPFVFVLAAGFLSWWESRHGAEDAAPAGAGV